jgi:hypothetical protein
MIEMAKAIPAPVNREIKKNGSKYPNTKYPII